MCGPASPGKSPACDFSTLIELFDDDRQAVIALLDAALRAIEADIPALRLALEGGQPVAGVTIAHRLKGTSGTNGAAALIERAARIETTARACGAAEAARLLVEVEAAAAAVGAEIAEFRGRG